MFPELALKLAPILDAYFPPEDVRELAALFDINLTSTVDHQPRMLSVARELTETLEQGNTRRLLDSLLDLAESRNNESVAHTTFERQTFHQEMSGVVREAKELLETSVAPPEIAVAAGSVFSAKSRVREILETATDSIFVVDPYVGLGTLDCLRNLTVPIRLLTGTQLSSIETDFDRAVQSFCAEGHTLQVRQVGQLHDRHLVFNDRCWLVGGSLKDAGKKPFNCIEITDEKVLVVTDLEAKWQGGTPFP